MPPSMIAATSTSAPHLDQGSDRPRRKLHSSHRNTDHDQRRKEAGEEAHTTGRAESHRTTGNERSAHLPHPPTT